MKTEDAQEMFPDIRLPDKRLPKWVPAEYSGEIIRGVATGHKHKSETPFTIVNLEIIDI
jgi:hypothetical protein